MESVHIEEVTETEAEAKENRRRCTRSEVWGTDPIRQSERLTGQSKKVLIMKTKCNTTSRFQMPTPMLSMLLKGHSGKK